MTLDEMKHYVDTCIDAYPQSINRLALTGGECFLLGDALDEIVRYGAKDCQSILCQTDSGARPIKQR